MMTNRFPINVYVFILFGMALLFIIFVNYYPMQTVKAIIPDNTATASTTNNFIYKNEKYGFSLQLGKEWQDFKEVDSEIQFGRQLKISKNISIASTSYAFIPILIYPIEKWRKWEANNFQGYPTAAPIGPSERGRNVSYVFATAPRYNFDYLEGFEEVEEILKNLKPL